MSPLSLLCLAVAAAAPRADDEAALRRRVERVLAKTPLIDGHNDVPWQVRSRAGLVLEALPLDRDTRQLDPPMHTDLPRLREGRAGAVFWSVWVPTSLDGPEAVLTTLEQIDVVHQLVARWPDTFGLATTADEVIRLHREGRIASLIGVEGGHAIGESLGALRVMRAAGAAYLTLTHWRSTPWADAATDAPRHDGLTPFGEEVVRELNRLGMLVDLSHVSAATMRDALRVTEAPVIFSHSGAASINPHPRNVPDEVLDLVKSNGGVVMIDFLPAYVSEAVARHGADRAAARARLESLHLGDPPAVTAGLAAWDEENPAPRATLGQVADHADAIRNRIGAAHVGLGSDFDGMEGAPVGLEDVSRVPDLLVELARRGWTDEELAGIAGGNVLRVMREAEAVAARLADRPPSSMRTRPAMPGEEDH